MDSAVAEPLDPGDPREIGQFTIVGLLGVGGMGEVYLGTRQGRYVAVKRVRSRLVSIERFNREVAILHRVPLGVAPAVLASDNTDSEPWLATEYVPGLTLDDAVRAHGPLPADALWLLLAETAAHLQTVHNAGIVHRDLKPANIMLVRDGVKLIDFGIALAADQSRLTRYGESSGTRGFIAPEQDAGDREAAAPADIYSLGATLVYASSMTASDAVPDIEVLRAVDPELADVAESCTAADPKVRPTAGDLAAAARQRISATNPAWPPAIMDRIAERRSFATTSLSKAETVLPPEPDPTEPRPDRADRRSILRRRSTLAVAATAALCGTAALVLTVMPGIGPRTNPTTSPKTSSGAKTSPAGPSTSPSKTTPSPASSSITGIVAADDPARVPGSEADTAWVADAAACSAWLDTDGSGNLAAVLNTSLYQSCGAELFRSDGLTYTFSQSQAAKKTTFIADAGYTMWVCVWHANEQTSTVCSPHFAMNGTPPVAEKVS